MKKFLHKIRFILIVVVIMLPGPVACAQASQLEDTNSGIISDSRTNRWKLRQAGITFMEAPKASSSKEQLKEVIEDIQLLKDPTPKPAAAIDVKPVEEIYQTPKPQTPLIESAKTQKSGIPAKTPDRTNRALTALIENPQNVINPLAVAESLFVQGNTKAAVKFYKIVIDRTADKKDHPDRPWALFQAANCLRHDDTAAASQFYQQLITEYPASDWTAAANSQRQIIAWRTQNNPKVILEKYISDPNSL
ncbi:MAG: tetratricopeptide repeat protein [Planctomycetota bacterium]|jgi:tetratricopeptide (TPR) repeat protein